MSLVVITNSRTTILLSSYYKVFYFFRPPPKKVLLFYRFFNVRSDTCEWFSFIRRHFYDFKITSRKYDKKDTVSFRLIWLSIFCGQCNKPYLRDTFETYEKTSQHREVTLLSQNINVPSGVLLHYER